jgi:DNA-binding IclR family transcriptional regulator
MELKTIEKALLVFDCFAKGESILGTTELANRLGTNKATMSRILSTLKKHGYLEQEPRTRGYRLGPSMVRMAQAVHRTLHGTVAQVAVPVADALRDKFGETIHLEVKSGNNLYLSYVAITPNPVSLNIDVGDQVMPHANAGSKAIIAHSSEAEIDTWLSKELPKYTENTVTDTIQIKKMFEDIRASGIAFDSGEYFKEISAVGAPIFDHKNEPVAGLVIVVPSYRRGNNWREQCISELKRSANEISSQLHSTRKI